MTTILIIAVVLYIVSSSINDAKRRKKRTYRHYATDYKIYPWHYRTKKAYKARRKEIDMIEKRKQRSLSPCKKWYWKYFSENN